MNTKLLEEFAAEQQDLLKLIVASLKADPRFVAAWLSGSFGRAENDKLSDLDITVVVSHDYSDELCAREQTINAYAPQVRLDLFRQFGEIGFAYENNNNASTGGTATNTMYLPTGARVDWVLVPEEHAQYPENSKLLFAHIDLPAVPNALPVNQEQRAKEAEQLINFFWLMATGVAKYLIRGDAVFVICWMEHLTEIILQIERRIQGVPDQYRRGSRTSLHCEPMEQLQQLQGLYHRAKALTPQVMALGGRVWTASQMGVERWLNMAEQVISQRSAG